MFLRRRLLLCPVLLLTILAFMGMARPGAAQSQLSISKSASFTVVNNGNDVEYTFTIEVCNNGSSPTGYVVADQLPDEPSPCEGTFVSASAPGLSITASNPSDTKSGATLDYFAGMEGVEWDSGGDPLDPGDCRTLTVVVRYDGSCGQDLTNSCFFTEGDVDDSSDDVTFNPSVDLPVELASFTATLDGRSAQLQWRTTSETNNAGFEVQHRPPEQAAWTSLRFVPGAGTTTQPQDYRFRTGALAPGPHVFRLRQVDFDGASELSPEVQLAVQLDASHALTWGGPNPFTTRTRFTLQVRRAQQVRIAVFDVLGRRVRALHRGPLSPEAAHTFTLTSDSLPSGVYFVRVVGERFQAVRRVTIAR